MADSKKGALVGSNFLAFCSLPYVLSCPVPSLQPRPIHPTQSCNYNPSTYWVSDTVPRSVV